MSNTSSPTLDEVVGNILEEILREGVEEENQETAHAEKARQETEEIVVEVKEGEARSFYFDKGVDAFKKHQSKKGFVEKEALRSSCSPSKRRSRKWAGKQ